MIKKVEEYKHRIFPKNNEHEILFHQKSKWDKCFRSQLLVLSAQISGKCLPEQGSTWLQKFSIGSCRGMPEEIFTLCWVCCLLSVERNVRRQIACDHFWLWRVWRFLSLSLYKSSFRWFRSGGKYIEYLFPQIWDKCLLFFDRQIYLLPPGNASFWGQEFGKSHVTPSIQKSRYLSISSKEASR